MPIIGFAIVALQLFVVVHAYRTGRPYWWIFVIMAFPVFGSIVYYIIEVMPGSRQERGVQKIGRDIVKALNPDKEMHRRVEELAICGSIHNKLALAAECTERGQFDDAIRLYESAREGQYTDAPDLLLGLARALFFNGEYGPARELLVKLRTLHPAYYAQDVVVLGARAAYATGDATTALDELAEILERAVGLEARYRYAEILWQQGETLRAKAELARVVEHARKFRVRDDEKEWAKLAHQTLAAVG